MEGASAPAPTPNRKRRVLLVLVVAAVVASSGFVVWWELVRVRSIAEVLAFDHFAPGTSVVVQGTITGIHRENTSLGPKVFLALDHESQCNQTGQVFGDPNDTYALGQTFVTTLHFQSSTINGDRAVYAPELACPFPSGFMDLTDLFDAISRIQGILLVYNGSEPGGWRHYEVFTHNDQGYNLSVLPAFLEKSAPVSGVNPALPAGATVDSAARWNALLSVQYIGGAVVPGRVFPLVDQMDSLVDGTSVNGSLRFTDANGDRMLDDGDRLDVHIPLTSDTAWSSYFLQIGGRSGTSFTYVGGEHFLLSGPQGPLDPLLSSMRPMVDLAYVGTQPGPPLQSTLQVASVRIGPPLPLSALRYLFTDWTTNTQSSGSVSSLPTTTAPGITLSFADSNADNLLDAGDRFTVTGVANRTDLSLLLLDSSGGVGDMGWIVGYGPTVGGIQAPTLTVQGSGPWTIQVAVPGWSPELAFNRTVRATLRENVNPVLTNVSLVNGTLGTFANGSLTFTDADGNGYLSTGDFFTLAGDPANRYELDLTFLFGAYEFRAFV